MSVSDGTPSSAPITTDEAPAPSQKVGEYIFAALALGLGIFVLVGAFAIRVPAASSAVGPRAFPFLVSGILIVAAVMVLVDIWRGRLGPQEDGEDVDTDKRTDWLTLAKLTGFIVAHIVLIQFVGWPIAAGILFGGVAWTLGAKKWWVGLLVGFALASVIYLVFAVGLGLSLPIGPLFSSR